MIILVIDTQKGITDERLFAFEQFKSNIRLLISEARDNGVEIVYVRHDDGPGTGFSVGDEEFEIYEKGCVLSLLQRFYLAPEVCALHLHGGGCRENQEMCHKPGGNL